MTDLERPAFTAGVDRYQFTWEQTSTIITLERIRETRDGDLRAEITVHSNLVDRPGPLHRANINLMADRTVKQLAGTLATVTDRADWYGMLLQVVDKTVTHYRHGDPLIHLADLADPNDDGTADWILDPFVLEEGATVFFAKGGSGKGYLACALTVTMSTGVPILGVEPSQVGTVAYLDWEASQKATHKRLLRVARGASVGIGGVYYKRMRQSLASAADQLANEFADNEVVAVIIDSLGLARFGAPESAEVTIEMFNAIARLGVPAICIDHVSKSAQQGDGPDMPIGSVYTENSARCCWSLKSEHRPGSLNMFMKNTKVNDGPRAKDRNLDVTFSGNVVEFRHGMRPPPRSGTVVGQIVAFIANNGGSATTKEIADELGKKPSHVRSEGSKHPDKISRVGGLDLWRVVGDGDLGLPNPFDQ